MNVERVKLIKDAIVELQKALRYEDCDYPPLFAKQHTDSAEKLIVEWKKSHKFPKLNGKWL